MRKTRRRNTDIRRSRKPLRTYKNRPPRQAGVNIKTYELGTLGTDGSTVTGFDVPDGWTVTLDTGTNAVTATVVDPTVATNGTVLNVPVTVTYQDGTKAQVYASFSHSYENVAPLYAAPTSIPKGDSSEPSPAPTGGKNLAASPYSIDAPEGWTADPDNPNKFTTADGWTAEIDPATGVVTATVTNSVPDGALLTVRLR